MVLHAFKNLCNDHLYHEKNIDFCPAMAGFVLSLILKNHQRIMGSSWFLVWSSFHMQVWAGWRETVGGSARITIECTCKLPVAVATVTKLGDQLPVELEDEDAAGLVVDHDDVAVPVHGHAFRAHQLPRADLVLEKNEKLLLLLLLLGKCYILCL